MRDLKHYYISIKSWTELLFIVAGNKEITIIIFLELHWIASQKHFLFLMYLSFNCFLNLFGMKIKWKLLLLWYIKSNGFVNEYVVSCEKWLKKRWSIKRRWKKKWVQNIFVGLWTSEQCKTLDKMTMTLFNSLDAVMLVVWFDRWCNNNNAEEEQK